MNDLGMDSLDAVEVVMAFEDEFGKQLLPPYDRLYRVIIQNKFCELNRKYPINPFSGSLCIG